MMEVRITDEAQAQYARLPKAIALRVLGVFRRLAEWPDVSGAKPLRRELKGHFRIRTGDWRVIFRPSGNVVWVVRIDNRKDVYEE
jgi:mRNA interferase RelE/StbE